MLGFFIWGWIYGLAMKYHRDGGTVTIIRTASTLELRILSRTQRSTRITNNCVFRAQPEAVSLRHSVKIRHSPYLTSNRLC